jgi:hypothetical protein
MKLGLTLNHPFHHTDTGAADLAKESWPKLMNIPPRTLYRPVGGNTDRFLIIL